jgi:hypothetical protein
MSRKGLLRLLALPMLLAGAMVSQAVPAYADATISTTMPYSNKYSNPCPGSTDLVIPVSGQMHMVIHSTTTTNGATRINELDNAPALTGTAILSMNSYVVNQLDKFFLDLEPGGTMVTDILESLRVVSQGSSPNFTHRVQIHLTINAQGLPTATVSDLDDTCTG